MDEADRSISSESKIILPRVGFQVLDSLREVFNKLRTPTFFTIGTTTQAWKLIENWYHVLHYHCLLLPSLLLQ